MYRIFIISIIIISALGLKAQFSVGVRQGYGSYGVNFEPSQKYQVPFNLSNSGLVIIYNSIDNSGLQMEINYASKGWREVDSLVDGAYFERRIKYLEIPLYSRWEVDLGKVRPIIFAGPYLAWKLSETTDSANYSHIWNESHPYNHFEQTIKDVDFGIKLGLGIEYKFTKQFAIYIDGRYDFQIAGGRDIFIDRPNGISMSRLKEISGTIGIVWHIIPQKEKAVLDIYKPKEDLYEEY